MTHATRAGAREAGFRAKSPPQMRYSRFFKAEGRLRGRPPPPQFRTIQVGPKDLPAALRQGEPAGKRPQRMSRKSGSRFSDKDMRKKVRGHFWKGASHVFGMRRREFISLLGGAAMSWPIMTRAPLASEASGQRGNSNAQQPAMPVIGFLSSISEETYILAAFRRGLLQEGYVEGRNVRIEYRYADGQYDRLPGLARELASLPVNVIATVGSSPAALAAKGATSKIPIVFFLGADVVGLGLVASYNLPGGNITGVSITPTSLTPKRLELLDGLVPQAAPIALLVNPTNRLLNEELKLAQEAARLLGRELIVLEASAEGEIDAALETRARRGARGLVVWQEAYLNSRRHQIVALAARQAIPAVYPWRVAVEAGGLMSYGADLSDAYRQVGNYTGRILKGAKPAELPVLQPTKFELVINLKAAKTLGLTIPPKLLTLADEVIE